MYTVREFAKKRVNSGVFARFVLFLSGIKSGSLAKATRFYLSDTPSRDSAKAFLLCGFFYSPGNDIRRRTRLRRFYGYRKRIASYLEFRPRTYF